MQNRIESSFSMTLILKNLFEPPVHSEQHLIISINLYSILWLLATGNDYEIHSLKLNTDNLKLPPPIFIKYV